MTLHSDLRLHHVGIVVAEIESKRSYYTAVLPYRARTSVIHDPVQTAMVQFLSIPGADHYLELVAPDGEESKLAKAARKKLPLNHLCYSCADIDATVGAMRDAGSFTIQEPVEAVAFLGQRIAWVMSPDQLLLELVERRADGTLPLLGES